MALHFKEQSESIGSLQHGDVRPSNKNIMKSRALNSNFRTSERTLLQHFAVDLAIRHLSESPNVVTFIIFTSCLDSNDGSLGPELQQFLSNNKFFREHFLSGSNELYSELGNDLCSLVFLP